MLSWFRKFFVDPASTGAAGRRATLFVVSAPSGAGKTSLVKALLERDPCVSLSISHTTRPMRASEADGEDYFFVDRAVFDELERDGQMLESAEVFGNRYGTSRKQVEERLAAGLHVVLEIDWQGARLVRAAVPACRSIFVLPPSREELERRLRDRATDTEEVIVRRLAESMDDMSHWADFDYVVVNDNFADALDALAAIVAGRGDSFGCDQPGLAGRIHRLLGTSASQ